jgi:acetyl/propionyl-CoA carboxylase alpha subunit
MAKIIAHGPTRAEALARLRQALDDARIVGVASNIGFYRRVLADPEFAAGGVDTAFLARFAEREAAVLEG